MKTDYEDVWDWRVENDNKPLWTRSPKDVAEADYNEFFKQVGWGWRPNRSAGNPCLRAAWCAAQCF